MLEDVMLEMKDLLKGRPITAEEVELLRVGFGGVLSPDWLLRLLENYAITTARFKLSKRDDISGMGVDLRWLTVAQILDEGKYAYPGIAAATAGYLPIGMCLDGRGDPYFLKVKGPEDSEVVRIVHDRIFNEQLEQGAVEPVTYTLEEFFRFALKK